LREVQATALGYLADAPGYQGAFLGIPVGGGKTLISLLAPKVLGCEGRAVLLAPANLRAKTEQDFAEWVGDYPCDPPVFVSYEKLSHPNGAHLLDELDPDLVICDEAHCLGNAAATRTKRFMRWARERLPGGDRKPARFVFMSGSFLGSGIEAYAHLAALALHEATPVPLGSCVDVWSSVVDYGGEPRDGDIAYLQPLADWANTGRGVPAIRRAYGERLANAPGVVWRSNSSCDKPLNIYPWVLPLTEGVRVAQQFLDNWELPDGTYLVSELEVARHASCIPYGFYTTWDWDAVGGIDHEWNDARLAWASAVRGFLSHSDYAGLDSPALVARAVEEGRLPGLRSTYEAWMQQAHKPAPPTVPVIFDPNQVSYLHNAVSSLPEGTLVWYASQAIADMLEGAVPVYRAGDAAPTHGRSAAVSVHAHGTGNNLQMYHRNLVLQPSTGVKRWEQMLGRTHRSGQDHPVDVHVAFFSAQQKGAFYQAYQRAKVVSEQGQAQKLVAAQLHL
jgi:hypothetical protein